MMTRTSLMAGERREIPADNLTIDAAQSRRGEWTGDEADQRLVESIEATGLINEVLVRPVDATEYASADGSEYAIVAGSRRYHALLETGETVIPCKVVSLNDVAAIKASLAENVGRKELTDHEKARAVQLWFELIRPPDKTDCGICGDTYSTASNGFIRHLSSSHDLTPEEYHTKYEQEEERPPYSPTEAYEQIAQDLYGDPNRVSAVRELVRAGNLDRQCQILMKQPAERTESERQLLERHDIPVDLTLAGERSTGLSRAMMAVNSLDEKLSNEADDLDSPSQERVLDIVGEITTADDVDRTEAVADSLREVSKRIDESLVETDSLEEAYEIALGKQDDDEPGIKAGRVSRIQFKLSEQYQIWHQRAKAQRRVDSSAELVRQVYQEWLAEQAEKKGWEQ